MHGGEASNTLVTTSAPYPRPPARRLRVFAFDPEASGDFATATINSATIALPWEERWERPITPGPCNEYLEVIDHDPASGLFYEPVDLDDPWLLAQDGLPPSEGRPQFHQQMVFAVAMKTIRQFERALGRLVYWAQEPDDAGERLPRVRLRLRIHPHALREDNAFYSPTKCALLFGYFVPVDESRGDKWVFTCLSHDIIAHETAHALLHGLHRRSILPTSLDTLAFHEGFSDIVALLQHFTMDDVVRHQLAAARGNVRASALLTGLAGQFGRASGRGTGALRRALDLVEQEARALALPEDDEQRAELLGSVRLNDAVASPHARGGYLVAAVFEAFLMIYESQVADLMRLALGSSAPTGAELGTDLVARLADEASRTADQVLRMCVRALDYMPPVAMTFGEYLRAIITADRDLVPHDPKAYRVAVAQAFRHRRIIPPDSVSMAPDSLCWEPPDPSHLPAAMQADQGRTLFRALLSRLHLTYDYAGSLRKQTRAGDRALEEARLPNGGISLRGENQWIIQHNEKMVWNWILEQVMQQPFDGGWERLLGIALAPDDMEGVGPRLGSIARKRYGGRRPMPVFQVYSVRAARRAGPDGQELNQLVVQVAQRRQGYFSPAAQAAVDGGEPRDYQDFWFMGGATLLVDLQDGTLRTVVRKSIRDEARLARERAFHTARAGLPPSGDAAMAATYGRMEDEIGRGEPFAMVHRRQS